MFDPEVEPGFPNHTACFETLGPERREVDTSLVHCPSSCPAHSRWAAEHLTCSLEQFHPLYGEFTLCCKTIMPFLSKVQ